MGHVKDENEDAAGDEGIAKFYDQELYGVV
jgi:hypothetical protein